MHGLGFQRSSGEQASGCSSPPAEPGAKPPRPASVARPGMGLSRRHVAVAVAGLCCLWLVGVFARQVGDAAEAGRQAEAMRARNASLERSVAALEMELQLIQRPAYVASTARGYAIGSPGEIPFTVDRAGEAVPADAPGSVGIKAQPEARATTPLEAWLEVLFGP